MFWRVGEGSNVFPRDIYGRLILNVNINLYAYCLIRETEVEINAYDILFSKVLGIVGNKGGYNWKMKFYL